MNIYNNKISIEKLLKARNSLAEFIAAQESKIAIAASIQAFEYVYELIWKVLRKILIEIYGISDLPGSPRPTFNKAFETKLIRDLNFWLLCIEKRNETARCYEEEMAKDVYSFLPKFLDELDKVIEILKSDKL